MIKRFFSLSLMILLATTAWADVNFGDEKVISEEKTWVFGGLSANTEYTSVTLINDEYYLRGTTNPNRKFTVTAQSNTELNFADGGQIQTGTAYLKANGALSGTAPSATSTAGVASIGMPSFSFNASVAGTVYAKINQLSSADAKFRIYFTDGTTSNYVEFCGTSSSSNEVIEEIAFTSTSAGSFFITSSSSGAWGLYGVRFVPSSVIRDPISSEKLWTFDNKALVGTGTVSYIGEGLYMRGYVGNTGSIGGNNRAVGIISESKTFTLGEEITTSKAVCTYATAQAPTNSTLEASSYSTNAATPMLAFKTSVPGILSVAMSPKEDGNGGTRLYFGDGTTTPAENSNDRVTLTSANEVYTASMVSTKAGSFFVGASVAYKLYAMRFVPESVTAPTIKNNNGTITITAGTSSVGADVKTYYTTDGTDPTTSGSRTEYTAMFSQTMTTTIKAITISQSSANTASSVTSKYVPTIPTALDANSISFAGLTSSNVTVDDAANYDSGTYKTNSSSTSAIYISNVVFSYSKSGAQFTLADTYLQGSSTGATITIPGLSANQKVIARVGGTHNTNQTTFTCTGGNINTDVTPIGVNSYATASDLILTANGGNLSLTTYATPKAAGFRLFRIALANTLSVAVANEQSGWGTAVVTTPTVPETATVNDAALGNGYYVKGSSVTVTATPNTGYQFVNWKNGENVVSTEAAYTFTLNEDLALTANFAAKDTPIVENLSAATPTYNGNAQNLVTTPTVTGGTISYSTEEDGTYSETIPQGTNAGDYSVWYKVTGDATHADIASTQISDVKINKANYTVSGTATATATYGTLVKGIAISGLTVKDVSNNDVVGTWAFSTEDTEVLNVGNTTEKTATFTPTTANANYNALTQNITPTITAAVFTPVVTLAGWTYGSPNDPSLGNTNISGGEVSYYYKTGEADWTTTKPTDAGSHKVKATVAANGNYAESTSAEVDFAIAKYDITNATPATVIADQQYAGAQIRPEAPAIKMGETTIEASNYDVTYGANNTVGEGSIIYTAKNVSTNFTGTKTVTFNITNGDLIVAANNYEGTYDGTAHSITVTCEGSTIKYRTSDTGEYDLTENPTYTNVGTHTVYYQVIKDNYADVTGSSTITITPKDLTITAKPQTITQSESISTGVDQVEVSGLVDGDALTAITLTPSTAEVTTTGTITPSEAATTKGATNYNITYTAGNLTITASSPSTPILTITQPSGGGTITATSTGEVSANTEVKITATPESGYQLKSWKSGDVAYGDLPKSLVQTITMPESNLDITAEFEAQPATAPSITEETIWTFDGFAKGTILSGTKSYVYNGLYVNGHNNDNSNQAKIDGGNAAVETGISDNVTNYLEIAGAGSATSSSILTSFNIDAVGFYAGVPGTLKVYIKGVANDRGLKFYSSGNADATTTTNTTNGTNQLFEHNITAAGNVYILSTKGKMDIYAIKFVPTYDITVTQPTGGTVGVKVGDAEVTTDNTTATAGQIITLSNEPATNYTFTSYSVTKTAGGGDVTVTDGTFTMPEEAVTITATFTAKTAPTVTGLAAATPTYNGSAQDLVTTPTVTGGTITYSTTQDGTYTDNIPQGTNAGNYTVWYKVTGDAIHSDIDATEVTDVAIAKYDITNATPATAIANQQYAGAQIRPEAPAIMMGETTIEASNYGVTYGANNTVGEGSIIYTAKNESTNFTGTKTVTFNITNGDLIVAANNYEGTYDGTAHSITVTCEGATIKYRTSDTGEYELTENPTYTNVGSYTVYYQVTKDNYVAKEGSKTVTINAATLTATADNKSKTVGEANPELTVTVTGFVNDETAEDLTTAGAYTAPTATCAATTESTGEYPITVSGGSATNYNFNYVPGTLTITSIFGDEHVVSTEKTWTFREYETGDKKTFSVSENLYIRAINDRYFTVSDIETPLLLSFSDGFVVNINKVAVANSGLSYSTSGNTPTYITTANSRPNNTNNGTQLFAFNASVAGTVYVLMEAVATKDYRPRIYFYKSGDTGMQQVVNNNSTTDTEIHEFSYTSTKPGSFFIGSANQACKIYAIRFVPTGTTMADKATLSLSSTAGGTVSVKLGETETDYRTFDKGTNVTLTATANEYYTFTKWTIGESESTENPLTLEMDAAKTVTAVFTSTETITQPSISFNVNGLVTITPGESSIEGATIKTYYTIDNTAPTESSLLYNSSNKPEVIPNTTVRAISINDVTKVTSTEADAQTYTYDTSTLQKISETTTWTFDKFAANQQLSNTNVYGYKGLYIKGHNASNYAVVKSASASTTIEGSEIAVDKYLYFPGGNTTSTTDVAANELTADRVAFCTTVPGTVYVYMAGRAADTPPNFIIHVNGTQYTTTVPAKTDNKETIKLVSQDIPVIPEGGANVFIGTSKSACDIYVVKFVAKDTYTLTSTVSPEEKGEIEVKYDGKDDATTDRTFVSGANITVTAKNTVSGYTFKNWTGADAPDGEDANNPSVSLTMVANKSLTANYELVSHTLSVSYNNTGGTVTMNDGTEALAANYNESVGEGSVTLTATPASGYQFVEWTNADDNRLSTLNTYTFDLTADTQLKAVFKQPAAVGGGITTATTWTFNDFTEGTVLSGTSVYEYNGLYIWGRNSDTEYQTKIGSKTGSVTLAEEEISYTKSLQFGTSMGSPGTKQAGEYVSCSAAFKAGVPGTVYVYMDHNSGNDRNLTIYVSDSKKTEVNVAKNTPTIVSLNVASGDNVFIGASGGSEINVYAVKFVPATTYQLTVTQPSEGGTIKIGDTQVETQDIVEGSEVTLTAVASDGYEFDYWMVDGVQDTEHMTPTLTVTMDQAHSVTVAFKKTVEKTVGSTKSWTFNDLETSTVYNAITAIGNEYYLRGSSSPNRTLTVTELGTAQQLTFADGTVTSISKILAANGTFTNVGSSDFTKDCTAGSTALNSSSQLIASGALAFNTTVAGTCYVYMSGTTASTDSKKQYLRIYFANGESLTNVQKEVTTADQPIEVSMTTTGAGSFFVGSPTTAYSIYAVRFVPTTEAVKYTMTLIQPSAGGTISAKVGDETIDGSMEVLPGAEVTLTAIPAEGYQLNSWKDGNNAAVGNIPQSLVTTMTMPASAATITAEFKAQPTEPTAVTTEKVWTFDGFTAGMKLSGAGVYEYDGLYIGGHSATTYATVTAESSAVSTGISDDVTNYIALAGGYDKDIASTVTANTYKTDAMSFKAGVPGTVTVYMSGSYADGRTFNIWSGGIKHTMAMTDNSPVTVSQAISEAGSVFIATSAGAAKIYAIKFVPATTYQLTVTAGEGGNVAIVNASTNASISSGSTVEKDAEITLTITPDDNYVLTSISATGVTLSGTGNTRTFTMPAANVTINASWEAKTEESAKTEMTENVDIVDTNNATITSVEVGDETTTITISGTVSDGTNNVPVTTIAEGTFTEANTANVQSIDLSNTQVVLTGERSSNSVLKDIPENTLVYLPNSSNGVTGNNVIIYDGEGNDASDYTCTNFVMTDTKSYSVPTSFTATNATLSRTFTNGTTCTICLPYDVPAENLGGKIYQFSEVNGTTVKMTEKTGGLVANTPYIFVPSSDASQITATSVTINMSGTPNTSPEGQSFAFKGVFEHKDFTTDEISGGVYGFAADTEHGASSVGQFVKAANGAWIEGMRAYLAYSGSLSTAATRGTGLPEALNVVLVHANGSTTNIGRLELMTAEDGSPVYDLNGQRVENNYKGIVIQKGKKVVKK